MILALDPSLTCTGYLVLRDDGSYVTSGAIRTEPADRKMRLYQAEDDARRATDLVLALGSLELPFGREPMYVAIEQPTGSKSARTVGALKLTQGAITGWLAGMASVRTEIRWILPIEAKRRFTGRGDAGKDQMVQEAIRRGLPLVGPKPVKEAVADAYAVAIASGWITGQAAKALPGGQGSPEVALPGERPKGAGRVPPLPGDRPSAAGPVPGAGPTSPPASAWGDPERA